MKRIIRIDEAGWARCGKCGHKLFKTDAIDEGQKRYALNTMWTIGIEVKCHSCKIINRSSNNGVVKGVANE